MMILNNYCKNCGVAYMWQASGSWSLNYPEKYNDKEHCPECKKAIIEALEKIDKKTEIKWIPTNLVNLETLKRWEKEEQEEFHPLCRRIFAGGYNIKMGESTSHIHIRGREEHKDKFFHCSYWSKSETIQSITVKARVKVKPQGFARNTDPKLAMETGEYQIVCYELD